MPSSFMYFFHSMIYLNKYFGTKLIIVVSFKKSIICKKMTFLLFNNKMKMTQTIYTRLLLPYFLGFVFVFCSFTLHSFIHSLAFLKVLCLKKRKTKFKLCISLRKTDIIICSLSLLCLTFMS